MEILVALPLAMLAAVSAAMLLLQLARTARTQSAALAGGRELRHARLVLAGDLEPLDGRDLLVVSDTLLEFRGQLGVLRLCAVNAASSVDVSVPERSSDSWVAAIRPGDMLRVWQSAEQPAGAPAARWGVVTSPPSSLGPGYCGPDQTPQRRWRLTLADSMTRLMRGAAVSVHREVRFRHYRSGSEWWLGRQSRDGALWEGLQPVAGPLLSPAARGLRLEARAVSGATVTISTGSADSIRARAAQIGLSLRMARRVRDRWSPVADSIEVLVPLRATAYRERP